MILNRRGVVLGSGALLAAGSAQAQDAESRTLTGRFVQGGHALGRTWPRVREKNLTGVSAQRPASDL